MPKQARLVKKEKPATYLARTITDQQEQIDLAKAENIRLQGLLKDHNELSGPEHNFSSLGSAAKPKKEVQELEKQNQALERQVLQLKSQSTSLAQKLDEEVAKAEAERVRALGLKSQELEELKAQNRALLIQIERLHSEVQAERSQHARVVERLTE
jgi:vacuolar-type H+-ATPase subunit I/STV1